MGDQSNKQIERVKKVVKKASIIIYVNKKCDCSLAG